MDFKCAQFFVQDVASTYTVCTYLHCPMQVLYMCLEASLKFKTCLHLASSTCIFCVSKALEMDIIYYYCILTVYFIFVMSKALEIDIQYWHIQTWWHCYFKQSDCFTISAGLSRSLKVLESPGIGRKKIPGPGKSLNLGRGP